MTASEAAEITRALTAAFQVAEETYWDGPKDLTLDEPTKAYLTALLRGALVVAEEQILLAVLRLRDGAERPKGQTD